MSESLSLARPFSCVDDEFDGGDPCERADVLHCFCRSQHIEASPLAQICSLTAFLRYDGAIPHQGDSTDTKPSHPRVHRSERPHRLANFDYGSTDHAYFVTICARIGTPFTDDRLATEIVASLEWLRANRRLLTYAYCLMPDHLHLLVQLGEGSPPLSGIIGAFKSFTTRQSWQLGYHGTLWQPRYYDRVLRRSKDGQDIATYILANPVRKGLVTTPEEYLWSGTLDPM